MFGRVCAGGDPGLAGDDAVLKEEEEFEITNPLDRRSTTNRISAKTLPNDDLKNSHLLPELRVQNFCSGDDAISAFALGLEHAAIRQGKQIGGVEAVVGETGQTGADRHLDSLLVGAYSKRSGRHSFP